MRRKKESQENEMKDVDEMRPFQLYVVLACGIIILLIGVYLCVTNGIIHGNTFANRFGQGGNGNVKITGTGILVVAFFVLVFPVSEIIRQFIKRRRTKKMNTTNLRY